MAHQFDSTILQPPIHPLISVIEMKMKNFHLADGKPS